MHLLLNLLKMVSQTKINDTPPHKLQVTSDNRNELVLEYQEKRESGSYEEALDAFTQIAEFDEENNNYKGYVDVLGHIRICYKLMGDKCASEGNKKCAKENYENALATIEKALKVAEEQEFSPQETAVTSVHYASTTVALVKYLDSPDKTEKLNLALNQINTAIENLPGSQAHKAWPMATKAKILHLSGKDKEATEVLSLAETYILNDDEEVKNEDGLMKLLVWKSGLDLVKAEILLDKARIYRESGEPKLAERYEKLAEAYVNSMLALPEISKDSDPLKTRREQASRLIEN